MGTIFRILLLTVSAYLPCFCGLFLSCTRRFSRTLSLLFALLCTVLLLPSALLLSQSPLLILTISGILFLLFAQLLFQEKTLFKLLIGASYFAGGLLSLLLTFLTLAKGMTYSEVTALPLSSLLCFCLILLFTGTIPMHTVNTLQKTIAARTGQRRANLIRLLFLSFPICQYFLLDRSLPASANDNRQLIYLAIAVPLCIAADVALTYGIRSVERNAALRTRRAALSRQIDAQALYYRQVAGYYQQIRRMRHDLKNHVLTLKILLEDNDLQKAKAYAEQLRKESGLPDRPQVCAHPIADLFLAQKCADLSAAGIRLSLALDIPAELKLSNGDLLSALAHLIDSSVRVCRASGGDSVTLRASFASPFLILTITPAVSEGSSASEPSGETQSDFAALQRISERCHGNLSSNTEATVLLLREGASV